MRLISESPKNGKNQRFRNMPKKTKSKAEQSTLSYKTGAEGVKLQSDRTGIWKEAGKEN
jgi:hypothetical protein